MTLTHTALAWILPLAISQAATVNFAQTSVNDVGDLTISAVESTTYLESGVTYSTLTAPAVSTAYSFTHWTNSSYPAVIYRDAWGRSINPISFVLLEATTCTAHYLPTSLDSDSDGIADWFEIEYFGDLTRAESSDGDADGIQLLVEYNGGSHPLYGNANQAGGVAYADSSLITYNPYDYPTYTLRSEPVGTVDQSAIVPPATMITTPDMSQSDFGYWSLDGVPQRDVWGIALRQITFAMGTQNRTGVAYLFSGDSDIDGVPDAWEQYYYNSLANDDVSDTDGDELTMLVEYQGGYNPLYANSHQAGGVSTGSSGLVTVNLAGYSRYTLASNPSGMLNESAVVPDGSVVTTPNMNQSNFGYWTLDGLQQRDVWGAALRQISFTVNEADRAAVAYLLADDGDEDGINDGYEMYHYGNLDQDESSDSDGDGANLLVEFQTGSNPLYTNSYQAGGVSSGQSAMVVANLQPYERLGKNLVDGLLADFFSSDPSVRTGIGAGTYSAPATTDWDGDGDQDLFIAHEDGMLVFRNIGMAYNPNFTEITTGFTSLIDHVTSLTRPAICGGDWNGDGRGDLVIGGQTGDLRFIASSGAFSATASGSELSITGSTRALPALGDMNGDGRADLLVLLDDGTVRLYLNNGDAMPFVGAGTGNYLGVAAPSAISIAAGDIDEDGVTDVLLADNEGRIWEFLNQGGGSFYLQSKVWGGSYPGFASGLALAAVDLEGDGDLDLIGGLANGGIISLRDPSVGRPTGLVARPGANSVQLDWNPSWQSRIRGYHVYRGGAQVGPFDRLTGAITPLPSYLDAPVAAASSYYYVTGISQFYVPGNSTPRISESQASDFAVTQAGKVVLSVRPARGNPGHRIKIRVSIENAMGVAGNGMNLQLAYDPSKLTPWAQAENGAVTVVSTGLSRNLVFTDNGATANGQLLVTGTAGLLEPGAGKLFTLQFEVNPVVPKGTPLGVSISSATMFDLQGNPLNVQIIAQNEPEANDAFSEGDLDGDTFVTEADKALLQNLIKPKSRAATANELIAGDLNGDGKLGHQDLVLLVQLLNGP